MKKLGGGETNIKFKKLLLLNITNDSDKKYYFQCFYVTSIWKKKETNQALCIDYEHNPKWIGYC